MIKSFRDTDTELLWKTGGSQKIPANLRRIALRKLAILNAVLEVRELSVPPGNRLEALSGKRTGEYSVRVNDQYRICFIWHDGNAYDVEIVDYH